MTTVLQIFNTSETTRNFTSQQPGGVPTLLFLELQARKILTFLVVAQVINIVIVHQL